MSENFMEFFHGNVVRLESVVSGKCLRIGVDGSVDCRASDRDHKSLFVVDNSGDTDVATFRLQSKAKPGYWLACLEANTNNGAGRAVFSKTIGSTYKDGGREPRCEFRATNIRPGVFFIEGSNRFIGATEGGDICAPEDAVDPKQPGMFICTVLDGIFAPGKVLQFKNMARESVSPTNNLLRIRDIPAYTPNGKVAGNVAPPPPKVDCSGVSEEESTLFRVLSSSDKLDNYMDTFRRVARGGQKDAEGGSIRLQSVANPSNYLAINEAHGVVCGNGGKDCYFVIELGDNGAFSFIQQSEPTNGRLGFLKKTGAPKIAHTVQLGPEAFFSAVSLSNE